MGLFKKSAYGGKGFELSFGNILVLVLGILIFVQTFGLLFPSFNINLGPIFIIISVVAFSAMTMIIVKKVGNDSELSKKDVFAIVIAALITLVVLLFLRDFVPEVFAQSLYELQAIINI